MYDPESSRQNPMLYPDQRLLQGCNRSHRWAKVLLISALLAAAALFIAPIFYF